MISSPDRNSLFTCDTNGYLKQWNAVTGAITKDYGHVHNNCINCMAITENGKNQFTGSGDGHVKEWNTITNKLIKDYGQIHDYSIWTIAVIQK